MHVDLAQFTGFDSDIFMLYKIDYKFHQIQIKEEGNFKTFYLLCSKLF